MIKKKSINKKPSQANSKLDSFNINYEKVFRNINDGILIHKNGLVIDANEAFLKLFDYKLTEIKGTSSFDNIIHPLSRDLVRKKIKERYEKPYEIYGVRKNGTKFPMEFDAREFNANGINLRIVSCRDITNRKKTQETIINQEIEFKRIFDNFQDLYYRTDLDGVIKLVSPSVKVLTGYNPQDIIGKKSSEIYYNPEDRDIFLKEIKNKGEVRNFNTKLINNKGQAVDVSITSHIIFDANKKPIGIEGIIRDITNDVKSENKIKMKMAELERLNKLMIGRELKMVELKEKINQLNTNRGQIK